MCLSFLMSHLSVFDDSFLMATIGQKKKREEIGLQDRFSCTLRVKTKSMDERPVDSTSLNIFVSETETQWPGTQPTERERPFQWWMAVPTSAWGEPGWNDLFYIEKVRQSQSGNLQLIMNKLCQTDNVFQACACLEEYISLHSCW